MNKTQTGRYRVCRNASGRLRVKVPAIQSRPSRAWALERNLEQKADVRSAEVRHDTGSVILTYDPSERTSESMTELLADALDEFDALVSAGEAQLPAMPAGRASGLQTKRRLHGGLARLLGFAAFAGFWIAKNVLFKAPVKSTSVALAAVVGSIPLFARAVSDLRQGRVLGLDSFLSGASILAIASGDSPTALEVQAIRELGGVLENYVEDRSRRAVRDLLRLRTVTVHVVLDGSEVEIPMDRLRPGDVVVVRAQEQVPADGQIVEGEALVDEATMRGTAEPELRGVGDNLFAGTVLAQGLVKMRARHVGSDTYGARLLDRVEQALEARSPVEKRADELAGRLAWLGLGATLLTLLVSRNVGRAAAVQLVMSCPCATVLAASTAVSAALANAADSHVLIKGGRYLEAFKTVDCICLDKTGTVTGKAARIVSVETVSASTTEEELLALAASAELHNAHPLARAIVREARIRGLTLRYDLTEEVILGRGVKASSAELEVVIGNEQFLRQEGVPAATFPEAVKAFIEKGCSCVYVAWNKALRGFIVFSLELKPDVRQVLQSLRESGVSEIHLVSGDTAKAVTALSQDLGVDGVLAEALPEDKARYVERLRRAGHRVAMVGDGINDALALSKADVGVALGTAGVESALSVADIAVARDELDSLLFLRALSDRAMYIVDFNHWLAVSTNIVGAALAGTGRLSPAGAGILHLVHSSGILLNSSSLLKWKRKPA